MTQEKVKRVMDIVYAGIELNRPTSEIAEKIVSELATPPPQGLPFVKSSERNPEKSGYYYSYRHENKVYAQMAYWYADKKEWSTMTYEWLDESAAQQPVNDGDLGVYENFVAATYANGTPAPAPQTDAVAFAEWLALNKWKRERARNGNGLWYVQAAGYGGGEPQMYTTEQLYQIFKQNK